MPTATQETLPTLDGGSSRDTFQTRVYYLLGTTSSDKKFTTAKVQQAIQDAVDRFTAVTKSQEITSIWTLVADTRLYALLPSTLSLVEVWWEEGGERRLLLPTSMAELDQLEPNWTTVDSSRPRYWFLQGSNYLGVHPRPDSTTADGSNVLKGRGFDLTAVFTAGTDKVRFARLYDLAVAKEAAAQVLEQTTSEPTAGAKIQLYHSDFERACSQAWTRAQQGMGETQYHRVSFWD